MFQSRHSTCKGPVVKGTFQELKGGDGRTKNGGAGGKGES